MSEISKRLGVAAAREEMRIWSEAEISNRLQERSLLAVTVVMALVWCWSLPSTDFNSLQASFLSALFLVNTLIFGFMARSAKAKRIRKREERLSMIKQASGQVHGNG